MTIYDWVDRHLCFHSKVFGLIVNCTTFSLNFKFQIPGPKFHVVNRKSQIGN